jgi:type II restriction enzyme
MMQLPNNQPVADFICPGCREIYELKSLGRPLGRMIGDGAYKTMIERLGSTTNPNLFLLHYDPRDLRVRNLVVVPRYFFVPSLIEPRKPLAATARRAGWTGCNIALHAIPAAGRIFLIRNSLIEPRETVLAQWRQTRFLRDQDNPEVKSWLLTLMRCIERLNAEVFTLDQCYRFEDELRVCFPGNCHIRPKIRQKLQVLRDKGYLTFLGRGTYRLTHPE